MRATVMLRAVGICGAWEAKGVGMRVTAFSEPFCIGICNVDDEGVEDCEAGVGDGDGEGEEVERILCKRVGEANV